MPNPSSSSAERPRSTAFSLSAAAHFLRSGLILVLLLTIFSARMRSRVDPSKDDARGGNAEVEGSFVDESKDEEGRADGSAGGSVGDDRLPAR